jgi:hypothetical protein
VAATGHRDTVRAQGALVRMFSGAGAELYSAPVFYLFKNEAIT